MIATLTFRAYVIFMENVTETSSTVSVRSPFDRTGCRSTRSKAANGKLLPLTDGRSAGARRFRDLIQDISADLGGIAMLSEGQRQLVRRAAMLSATCEVMEAQAARGEAEFDIDLYGMICDRLGRLFGRLGLERVARPVNDGSQALSDYFSSPPPKEAAP
jgi:hypothetical protein